MRFILTLALLPAIALASPVMFASSCNIYEWYCGSYLVAHRDEFVFSFPSSILLEARFRFFSFVEFANIYSMLQATVEKISRKPSMAAELLPIRTMFGSPVWMGINWCKSSIALWAALDLDPRNAMTSAHIGWTKSHLRFRSIFRTK